MWVKPVNSTDVAAGRWIGAGVSVVVGVATGTDVRVGVAIVIVVAVSVFDGWGMGELVGEGATGFGVTEGVDVGVGLGVDDAGSVSSATDRETNDDAVDVGKGVGTY